MVVVVNRPMRRMLVHAVDYQSVLEYVNPYSRVYRGALVIH